MAKETKEKAEHESKAEDKREGAAGEKKEGGGKKKKLHLHEIRTTQAKDGSLVHHHTYKDHADAEMTHPERGPMATSATPEEAGQHVAEQFGMNAQQGGGGGAGEGESAGAGGPEPQAV
ncbi:MAG: hypothetical protein WBQ94_04435 [Terracidiphilus sp.]